MFMSLGVFFVVLALFWLFNKNFNFFPALAYTACLARLIEVFSRKIKLTWRVFEFFVVFNVVMISETQSYTGKVTFQNAFVFTFSVSCGFEFPGNEKKIHKRTVFVPTIS